MWKSIFKIGEVIASWLTPEKQKERRRNKIAKLNKELNALLREEYSLKCARRIVVIRQRLSLLRSQAQND